MSAAFDSLLDVREKVIGFRETVNLNGVDVDALVEKITFEPAFVAGGIGESGGFTCQIAVDAVPVQPKHFDPIIVRNQTLKVLSCDDINKVVYLITAGDPTLESMK